jgi:DNA-binding NarL/FixJ family response regulator
MDAFSAIAQIVKASPGVKVLVLSMHDESHYVRRAIEAGARGYVLKDASSQQLARAVREVASGETFFSPRLSRFLLNDYVQDGGVRRRPRSELSEREKEVLVLIAQGRTGNEIAKELRIALRTVNTYRERLTMKLDLRGTAAITRYAVSHGLLKTEPPAPPARRLS